MSTNVSPCTIFLQDQYLSKRTAFSTDSQTDCSQVLAIPVFGEFTAAVFVASDGGVAGSPRYARFGVTTADAVESDATVKPASLILERVYDLRSSRMYVLLPMTESGSTS